MREFTSSEESESVLEFKDDADNITSCNFEGVSISKLEDIMFADRTVVNSVLELVENSIGAAVENDKNEVDIEIQFSDSSATVADNAGGIQDSDPMEILDYEDSEFNSDPHSTHTFGIGGTASIRYLSSKASVTTQHHTIDSAYKGKMVDKTDTQTAEDIEVKVAKLSEWPEFELNHLNLSCGCTVISLEELNHDLQNRTDKLKQALSEKFECFLREEGWNGTSANIYVNGDSIAPNGTPTFCMVPWATPKKFVPSGFESYEDVIDSHYVLGLVAGDEEESLDKGTDIFCNGIAIEYRNVSSKGGYQKGGPFSTKGPSKRTFARTHLVAKTNSKNLPWNSSKTEIKDEKAVDSIHSELENVGLVYRQAQKKYPEPLLNALTTETCREIGEPVENFNADWNPPNSKGIRGKILQLVEMIGTDERLLINRAKKAYELNLFPSWFDEQLAVKWYTNALVAFANSDEYGHWFTEQELPNSLTADSFVTLDSTPPEIAEGNIDQLANIVSERAATDKRKNLSELPKWTHELYKTYYETQSLDQKEIFELYDSCENIVGKARADAHLLITRRNLEDNATYTFGIKLLANARHVRTPEYMERFDSNELTIDQFNTVVVEDKLPSIQKTQRNVIEWALADAEGEKVAIDLTQFESPLYMKFLKHELNNKERIENLESYNKKAESKTEPSELAEEVKTREMRTDKGEAAKFRDDEELFTTLSRVMGAWFPNTRDDSQDEAKGRTFEDCLGVSENNDARPDIEELGIEVKVTGDELSGNLTIFSNDPPKQDLFGRELVEKAGVVGEDNCLSVRSPLKINERNKNSLKLYVPENSFSAYYVGEHDEYHAFTYPIEEVKKHMKRKLNRTLVVISESREVNNKKEFRYNEAYLYEGLNAEKIKQMVLDGVLSIQPRMKIEPGEGYDSKGIRWTIDATNLDKIFDTKTKVY